MVTAGLMWQPLMWPTEYTAAKIAKAKANEIVDSSALPNGFLPVRKTVSGTEPAPMNTRMAVPIASAVSFCVKVGDVILGSLLLGWSASRLCGGVDVGRQFGGQRGDRRFGIGAVRREGDLG